MILPVPFHRSGLRGRPVHPLPAIYLEAISAGGAEAAVNEMHSAITDMELAGKQLDNQKRSDAIPPEESALAHLYQVVKLMPELGNLPTTPMASQKPPPSPKVQVVLEAIKQKKKEQPDNKELQDALNQAKDLARAQSGLNSAMRHPGQPGNGNGSAQAQQAADQANSKSSSQSNQAGQAQANASGQGQGEGKSNDQNDSTGDKPGQGAQSPAQIADQEQQLSKEAALLAERLQRMAGKGMRLGHNLGNGASRASTKMAADGQAMAQGNSGAAGEQGFQGELALRNVIDQLERLLKNQPEPTDIAHEDSPKEYDTLISEYLKRLSHAE
jgi:hypothetical protein